MRLKIFTIIGVLFISVNTFAQADPCLTPFTPCWCQNNPSHPNCANVSNIPIDEHYWILIIGGMLMGGYVLYKKKLSTESE